MVLSFLGLEFAFFSLLSQHVLVFFGGLFTDNRRCLLAVIFNI